MYKKPTNPTIEDLTKSHRERRINLGDLNAIVVDSKKLCIWCLSALSGRSYKWCSKDCMNSAFAWANPQQDEGLQVLLIKQGWKCADCSFDYLAIAESLVINNRYLKRFANFKTEFSPIFMRWLKRSVPYGKKPEVDHITPIYKGGTALGFGNHQILCYDCHKKKTSKDLSGKRK